MNIYLDVNDLLKVNDPKTADLIDAFIKTITKHHTFWLARDHTDEEKRPESSDSLLLSETSLRLIETVRFMPWDLSRTEVIDFTRPFLWFTPLVYDEELEDLATHECLRNLVVVDLLRDTDQLQRLTNHLPKAVLPDISHSPYKHLYKTD